MEARQKEQLPATASEAQHPLLQKEATTSPPRQCGRGSESMVTTLSHCNEEGRKLGACGRPFTWGTSDITPQPPIRRKTHRLYNGAAAVENCRAVPQKI